MGTGAEEARLVVARMPQRPLHRFTRDHRNLSLCFVMNRTFRTSWVSRTVGWAACALSVLALFVAVVSGHAAERAAAPQVVDVWVRPALVAGRPAAGYLTIVGGAKADRLVGVTSSGLKVELHETMKMDGGMMSMAATPDVPVSAGARVAFAPGGRHLMIFGLASGVADVPLSLRFASGRVVRVVAHAKPPADGPPAAR